MKEGKIVPMEITIALLHAAMKESDSKRFLGNALIHPSRRLPSSNGPSLEIRRSSNIVFNARYIEFIF